MGMMETYTDGWELLLFQPIARSVCFDGTLPRREMIVLLPT